MVARQFGTDHHELHIEGSDLARVLDTLVTCHDEPFADAANVPLYLLCRELKGQIKVVLQGDGGDEIFAGYRRYNAFANETLWRTVACCTRPLRRGWPPKGRWGRAARFLTAMDQPDSARRMAAIVSSENLDHPATDVLAPELRQYVLASNPFARYEAVAGRLEQLDSVQRMLYTDASILLPDTYLEKVDKSTMAHGIEVRVPFLDGPLTDFALGLPSRLKVRRLQKKWILRKALRGIVSDHILDSPKVGFGVPVSNWMRGPLQSVVRDVVLTASHGLFDVDTARSRIDAHVTARSDHGVLIYRMYLLAMWYGKYFQSGSPTNANQLT
jgi:asparagine synthase (glutamine-hydrolysing)